MGCVIHSICVIVIVCDCVWLLWFVCDLCVGCVCVCVCVCVTFAVLNCVCVDACDSVCGWWHVRAGVSRACAHGCVFAQGYCAQGDLWF